MNVFKNFIDTNIHPFSKVQIYYEWVLFQLNMICTSTQNMIEQLKQTGLTCLITSSVFFIKNVAYTT